MFDYIQRALEARREGRERGFTLIELLVVIIIIGILAAIAIPIYLAQRDKGYDSQAKSDVRNMATAEETYLTETNVYGATADISFKTSPNVSNHAAVPNGATSYCVEAQSDSGNWFFMDSAVGGGVQQAAASQC